MLKHLLIENYALIRKLATGFCDSLTVITGETGAGKSILLGALSLILGERADTKILNEKQKKCVIEGTFDLTNTDTRPLFLQYNLDYEDISYFRREITPQGKSRAFINDTPVTLNGMKAIAGKLIDIHSQHESLMVGESSFQFAVVDSFANNLDGIDRYRRFYKELQEKRSRLLQAKEAEKQAKAELDYYQYQYDELEKAKPDQDEYRRIEEEAEILRHAEEISFNYEKSLFILQDGEPNVLDGLNEVVSVIKPLEKLGESYKMISERLHSVMVEVKDILEEINQQKDKVVHDPQRAAVLEAKIDEINKLMMKHNARSVEELLQVKKEYEQKIHNATSIEDTISQLQKEISDLEAALNTMASGISSSRKSTIPEIEKEILKLLKKLGMPDARFVIRQETTETLTINGTDQLRFMFNANMGGEMHDIARVASGGELSRVMLSIKSMISQKKLLPTIIFDEIDTGISGEISSMLSGILIKMADNMQVIAITHLPQIASRGHKHLFVYKEVVNGQTHTRLKQLMGDERIMEVAKMLGGKKPTKHMVETAKELIFNKQI